VRQQLGKMMPMSSRCVLIVSVGLCVIAQTQGYLMNADGKPIHTCKSGPDIIDEYKLAGEDHTRCMHYCETIATVVKDMETGAADKKCKQTADALAQMPYNFNTFDKEALKLNHAINEGTCLALLMNSWAARDAACSNVPVAVADDAVKKDRVKLINNQAFASRMLMIMVQYFNTNDVADPHRRSLDSTDIQGRRAGAETLPKPENMCVYELMEFKEQVDGIPGSNLFDKEKCGGKHPIWSEMKDCPATCWAHIQTQINKGGCIAMYYATMMEMVYGYGKINEGKDAVTVEKVIETLSPRPTIDEKCTGKKPPCTSIDVAITNCATAAGEKTDLYKYTSAVQKADAFGAVSKGGVKCWQGMDCH